MRNISNPLNELYEELASVFDGQKDIDSQAYQALLVASRGELPFIDSKTSPLPIPLPLHQAFFDIFAENDAHDVRFDSYEYKGISAT